MNAVDKADDNLSAKFLKSLDDAQVGAALSKLFAASIGDMVVVLSRSIAHKHYSLADIEWMVLPPVAAGQFYVVEAADKQQGFRAPVGVVTWALVSEQLDAQLRQTAGQSVRLRPDQWKCGDIAWIIDAVGGQQALDAALQWLAAGPFKVQSLNMAVQGADGAVRVTTMAALLAESAEAASTG